MLNDDEMYPALLLYKGWTILLPGNVSCFTALRIRDGLSYFFQRLRI